VRLRTNKKGDHTHLHQTATHVAGLCSLDGSIHQAFSATHGVEPELSGSEATVEGVGHKTLACVCMHVCTYVCVRVFRCVHV